LELGSASSGAYLPEPQSQVRGNASVTTSCILQVRGRGPGER
jgi:hypothetical protein